MAKTGEYLARGDDERQALEALLDNAIPIPGNRNVLLLERNLAEPSTAARIDRWFVIGVVAAVLVFLALLIWLGLTLLGWLLGAILPA